MPARTIFSFGSGCFPDSKGVFWLAFCASNSGIACHNLFLFIRLRTDAWPGRGDGRRLFRHAVPVSFTDYIGCLVASSFCAWNSGIASQNLDFSFGSRVTFGPGRGMKKSRFWQAIPLFQAKPQETLRIRQTPWHGVTEQPAAVHRNQATRHPTNQENTLARCDGTASCHPSAWPRVSPQPNEKIKVLAGNSTVPGNQGNTLAWRDGTASYHPPAQAKRHSCLNRMKKSSLWQAIPLFQAQKPSHKTPYKSGPPGTEPGRRLFRHAAPGYFPDSKGVFWLAFCALEQWNCLPEP